LTCSKRLRCDEDFLKIEDVELDLVQTLMRVVSLDLMNFYNNILYYQSKTVRESASLTM
jgi:hypothetical protein